MILKLDTKKTGSIRIHQEVIFKTDSNDVLKQVRKNLTMGKQEIIVFDESGEIIAKDTVFIGNYNLYDLTIIEIKKGTEKSININLTEVLLN